MRRKTTGAIKRQLLSRMRDMPTADLLGLVQGLRNFVVVKQFSRYERIENIPSYHQALTAGDVERIIRRGMVQR